MRRHPLGITVGALGGVLLAAAPTAAQGPPVENSTQHIVNEVSTDIDVHPCTGKPAEITIVESGVIHFAAFADGTCISPAPCEGRSPRTCCRPTGHPTPPAGSPRGSGGTGCSSKREGPQGRHRRHSPSTAGELTPTAPGSASTRTATLSSTQTAPQRWTSSTKQPTAGNHTHSERWREQPTRVAARRAWTLAAPWER